MGNKIITENTKTPYRMELELPSEFECPLCGGETVEIEENKNGRPKFFCQTFFSPVNLRGDESERKQFLSSYALDNPDTPPEMEAEADADADGEADDEPQTLGDVLNTEEK